MSYQEKNTTVELVCDLLILGFFVLRLVPMYRAGSLDPAELFSLWVIVIAAIILVNIVAAILTNILLSIVEAVRNGGQSSDTFIADERDRLIELKGTRISYVAFSLGVFLSMLTLVFGQPPLVMFSLLILSSITAESIGCIAQLYLYRRGV